MVSVYMYVKTGISRNFCANQYVVPTAGLEDISKLRAHSTSLINMAIIKRKQLQTCAWQCFKEGMLATLTKQKRKLATVVYKGMKRAPSFTRGSLELQKGKLTTEHPCSNVFFFSFSNQIILMIF